MERKQGARAHVREFIKLRFIGKRIDMLQLIKRCPVCRVNSETLVSRDNEEKLLVISDGLKQ